MSGNEFVEFPRICFLRLTTAREITMRIQESAENYLEAILVLKKEFALGLSRDEIRRFWGRG